MSVLKGKHRSYLFWPAPCTANPTSPSITYNFLPETLPSGGILYAYDPMSMVFNISPGDVNLFDPDLTNFSGNDVIRLVEIATDEVVDQIGDISNAGPWTVSGVVEGTKDHYLIRKPSIVAGSSNWTEVQNQWDVFLPLGSDDPDPDFIATLGTHPINPIPSALVTRQVN